MSEYDPDHVPEKHYFLLGVKIIIVNSSNEVLLLRRSQKSSSADSWGFPGGGVDENEAPALAAIREVQEETAVVIKDPKIITSILVDERGEPAVILGFYARVDSPEVVLNWEHSEHKWVSIDELESLGLPDLHQQILHAYIAV